VPVSCTKVGSSFRGRGDVVVSFKLEKGEGEGFPNRWTAVATVTKFSHVITKVWRL